MTYHELVRQLAAKLGISQKAARTALKQSLTSLEGDLIFQRQCEIPELGQIKVDSYQSPRQYIPSKNAFFIVPPRIRIVFATSKDSGKALAKVKNSL